MTTSKRVRVLISVLSILGLFNGLMGGVALAQSTAEYSVAQTGYTVAGGNTSYTYTLLGPQGGTVSHVVLNTCLEEADSVSHTAAAGEDDVIVYAGYGPDPTTAVTGHKWETDDSGDGEILVGATFTLTYNGTHNNADPNGTIYALKKQDTKIGFTRGPSCSSLTVKKTDDLDEPLNGAVFEAWLDDGDEVFEPGTPGDTLVGTCTTGEEGTAGQCTFEEALPGTYFVRETSAPPGYQMDPSVQKVTVGTQEHKVLAYVFVNPLILGSIKIIKTDSLGNLVQGVTFILYTDANSNGQFDSGEQATDRDGNLATCTTDLTGTCTIDDLVAGNYRLHEDPTTVPATMNPAPDQDVTVTAGQEVTVNFENPLKPSAIQIVKDGPAVAHRGDTVTYTFAVSIPAAGVLPLTGVVVTDPKCDAAPTLVSRTGGDLDSILELGETWNFTCSHLITSSDPDPMPNTATATGIDSFGRQVTDTDDHLVDLLSPAIQVVKDGPAEAHVGDLITYTFAVTNAGDTPLANVTLADPKCDSGPTFVSGDANSDTKLGLTETWNYTCTRTITMADATDGDGTAHTNTATTTGQSIIPGGSTRTVEDTDSHTLNIRLPAIQIVKTSDPSQVHVGDTVTYTFTVTNEGNATLENVTVDDDLCSPVSFVGGDTNRDADLQTTETWTFTCSREVLETDPTPLPNAATAEGDSIIPFGSTQHVTSEDDDEIIIIRPAINVEKTGSPTTVHVDDTITYTFDVTNVGSTPLGNVALTDPLCDSGPNFLGGDDGDDLLEVGEIWKYSCTHVVTASDPDPLPNIASVQGTDELGRTVTDDDNFVIDIIRPAIQIVKSGPSVAHVGDTITYTFVVTNVGDTTLVDVAVSDPLCDSAINFQGGDANGDGGLQVGEIWNYSCTHVVTASDSDPLPNIARADAEDEFGKAVTDTDDHLVDIIRPAIQIVKTGPRLAHVGDAITYTFTVTNLGDVELLNVAVTDPLCDSAAVFVGGDTDGDTRLDLTEAWSFTCTHVVTEDDPDPLPNTARVDAEDEHGVRVDDTDDHVVDLIHPAIQVVKTANPISGAPGDSVTYLFVITNIGDTTLFDITVDDNVLGHICDIESLEPGESEDCSISAVLGATGVTNVGTAVGSDELGKKVSDDDDATVSIVLPLEIVRRAPSPPAAAQLPRTGADGFPGLGLIAAVMIAGGWVLMMRTERPKGRATS
ncbi:MAG: DUF11 domain-containing protein [Actinobacteria bacterium]|nr:DUF11 domain-containing protein [Actinomycetota bacterium]